MQGIDRSQLERERLERQQQRAQGRLTPNSIPNGSGNNSRVSSPRMRCACSFGSIPSADVDLHVALCCTLSILCVANHTFYYSGKICCWALRMSLLYLLFTSPMGRTMTVRKRMVTKPWIKTQQNLGFKEIRQPMLRRSSGIILFGQSVERTWLVLQRRYRYDSSSH
ncbi:hypothetical protein DL93DRAFT_300002 [Clavulina sp. PMI_390]|nr:hypothetical protein DL93DRAFT_300002 [Clavulina sp. PMI_390]